MADDHHDVLHRVDDALGAGDFGTLLGDPGDLYASDEFWS